MNASHQIRHGPYNTTCRQATIAPIARAATSHHHVLKKPLMPMSTRVGHGSMNVSVPTAATIRGTMNVTMMTTEAMPISSTMDG